MSSYLPPTENPTFNPLDWPKKEESESSSGGGGGGSGYLPLTGGTLTGALVGTTITCTQLNADTLDATTVVEGDVITATQNGAARSNALATYHMSINPRSVAASGNALISADDHSILFTNGTNDSGALVIAPFSASSTGLRMDSTGTVNFMTNPVIMNSGFGLTIQSASLSANRTFTIPNTSGTAMLLSQSQTVSGTKTFSIAPILGSASNQLIIQPNGTGNTMTITASNPTSSRVYTLPDAGAASTFIMSDGNQTLTNTARFDTVNARTTIGGTTTHSQKTFILAGPVSGNHLIIGEAATESRGMISTNLSNSGSFGLDTDIGDTTRMFGLTNTFNTTRLANRGCALNFQNLPLTSNNGRTYNDIFCSREVTDQSTGQFLFNGFDASFANYRTMHRLGWQNWSFIGAQGGAGVTLNSNVQPSTMNLLTSSISANVLIGDGATSSTGRLYATGAINSQEFISCKKLNYRIPITKSLTVSTAGAKQVPLTTLTLVTTGSRVVSLNMIARLQVSLQDPSRTQSDANMSLSQFLCEKIYYYNPTGTTDNIMGPTPKETDVITGSTSRLIGVGSIGISYTTGGLTPAFVLDISVSGTSIATSELFVSGEIEIMTDQTAQLSAYT